MTKQERVAMGHRLRQQRTLLGLTREEFAELADISAGYYGQIEVGTSQMSIDTLIKLSKTSQLSMEYILLGAGPPGARPGRSGWLRRSSGCFCCGETHSGPAAAG